MPGPGLLSDGSPTVSQACVQTLGSLVHGAVFAPPLCLDGPRSSTFLFGLGLIVNGSFIFSIYHLLGWAWSPHWSYQLLHQQLLALPLTLLRLL